MRRAIAIALAFASACNPLGDHYEDKAREDEKKAAEMAAQEKALAEHKAPANADACADCHPTIVAEWKKSMHSRSTAEGDPLFALMKARADKVLGETAANERCRNCHYADWSAKVEEQKMPAVGVACQMCHRIHPRHPHLKLDGGKVSELARTYKDQTGPQGLCLSCHAELTLASGVPVCSTGPEAERAADAGKCVDCHMGIAEGPPAVSRNDRTDHRSHDFTGGHDPRFLRGAARIALARDGGQLEVTVKHGRAGHAVPTGNPMRFLVARIEQLDAAGKVIATNVKGDASPPFESGAVFMRVFSDADGNKPVPPFASTGEPVDTRLQPGDERTVRVAVVRGAVKARAILEYHLGPKAVLEAAKLPTEPAIVHQTELAL